MDNHILLECIVFFNLIFFLLWSIFYTYQPWFLKNSDFIAPGDTNRESSTRDASDKYLSDPGRSTIFLAALITALVVSIFLYLSLRFYFSRKQIKCKKGAKNMKDCKLIDINLDKT